MTSLKRIVLKIFGEETFGELNKWYHRVLEDNLDYVVFVVRRSYILALIMEKIEGKKMEDISSATFLSDASILLHCREMARFYIDTGRFPKLLICDDILIHGRNINHLIDAIEDELISLLPYCNPDKIRSDLEKSTQINVLKIASGISLLHGRYGKKLDLSLVTEPKTWRKLSNDISTLILKSRITNASYIYSMHITKDYFNKIKNGEKGLIHTNYRDIDQYTKVWCVNKGNYVKALLTLRFIKDDSGYRMAPFAFMPDIDSSVTEQIMSLFIDKVNIDDFASLMRLYHSYKGMRSYNEFLTFLLSNVILKDICQKYDIYADDDDVSDEIRKLARNYNFNTLRQTENCLKSTLKKYMFSIDELKKELETIIPDDEAVLLDEFMLCGYNNWERTNSNRVRKALEEYFYEKSWLEERKAYILKNQPYSPDINYSKRVVTSVFDVLHDTMDKRNENELDIYMAYILQMMDAGILAVSSYAPNDKEVDGLMQFAKAGEQSAAIYPSEMYEYIPVLAYMQEECDKWHIDLESEIDSFCGKHKEWFTVEKLQELKDFVKRLKDVGQKVSDWDWDYNDKNDCSNNIRNDLKNEYKKYISVI